MLGDGLLPEESPATINNDNNKDKKRSIDETDSNCKRVKKENKEFDRISELPDEIIIHILSLLSLRGTAATSVLSPRWSDLWKHTPNLDFGCIHNKTTKIKHTSWNADTSKYVKMVHSIIELHQSLSLKKFKICLYINNSAQSVIAKWLEFVWSRHVERLYLNLRCLRPKHRVVLEGLLGEIKPTKYLKALSLKNMKVGGEDISLLLRNCPLLKELSITSSSLTSDVHVSGATLALKHLRICRCTYKGSVVNISVPNLSGVNVDARTGKLFFENVPRLVVARFRIQRPKYTMHKLASALSCFTSQLQILILSLFNLEIILGKGFPQMPNLKKLIVANKTVYEHGCLLPITYVIAACPRLEKATFKI
ncbi:hypothetical protein AAHA92_20616 [Salvia divinorum]|uniref:F-box domain-containing protein n=1 Tax=Salvia divinorum TaxID=28513 RepID=A0ABD1GI55_SALDI